MSVIAFRKGLNGSAIAKWAAKYDSNTDLHVECVLAPVVRERGYFGKQEFIEVCEWKSPRSKSRCSMNSASDIESITRVALGVLSDDLKLNMLSVLHGVNWPTASVLLHFGTDNLYPILDYRALWSLGFDTPPIYNVLFWWSYVSFAARNQHASPSACVPLTARCGSSRRRISGQGE